MSRFITAVTTAEFLKTPVLMEELAALPLEVVDYAHPGKHSDDTLIELVNRHQIRILVMGLEPLTRRTIEACPTVEFVAKFGVGLDNLDLDEMKRRGIGLGWTGGVNKRSVSELALCMALGYARNIFPSCHKIKHGLWLKEGGRLLSGMTVGIVGLGHTGTDFATLLRALGTRVYYSEIVDKSEVAKSLGLELRSYDTIVEECDIISFHVPSTPKTRFMFGPEQIKRAKQVPLIINTSRGDIIDFEATCRAVVDGKVGSFASDAFATEPLDASPWRDDPRFMFTPHIGGNAHEAVLAMGRSAISHIKRFLAEKDVPGGSR